MSIKSLVLPFAQTGAGEKILLAQNCFVQTYGPGGKVAISVPRNAGQWTLVTASLGARDPVEETTLAQFAAFTGIDLLKPDSVLRYGFTSFRVLTLQEDSTPFYALTLETNEDGLKLLAADIRTNIQNRTVEQNLLLDVKVIGAGDALDEIGPLPVPSRGGWGGFVVRTYYNGVPPNVLNPEPVQIANALTIRTAQPATLATIAIEALPGHPQPTPMTLTSLTVAGGQSPVQLQSGYMAGVQSGPPVPYTLLYAAGSVIRVTAHGTPDGFQNHLTWEGPGEVDPTNPAAFLVPQNQVTRPGRPLLVTASIGESSLSVALTIVPAVVSVLVTNATALPDAHDGIQRYAGDYGALADAARIRVLLNPDTREAYEHLTWHGGTEGPSPGIRLVPRTAVTPSDRPLDVSFDFGETTQRFAFYIVPRIVSVVATGVGAIRVDDRTYELLYNSTGLTAALVATLDPNNADAQSYLHWTGNVNGADRITLARTPINAFGTHATYDTELYINGARYGAAVQTSVTVIPVLTGVTVAGCVFDDGGAYHAYRVASQPPALATAVTDPASAGAYAYIVWSTGVAVPGHDEQHTFALTPVGVIDLRVSIGHAPALPRPIDVRAAVAAPPAALNLAVDLVTYTGNAAVIHDNPADVGTPFAAEWRRGAVPQSPLAYIRNTNVTVTPDFLAQAMPAYVGDIDLRATSFVIQADNTVSPLTWTWPAVAVNTGVALHILPGLQASAQTLPNQVVNAEPLTTFWEGRIGAGPWCLIDATSSETYVTLAPAVNYTFRGPLASPLYYSWLAVSCRYANGATTDNAVLAGVQYAFAGLDATTGANPRMPRKLAAHVLTYWLPDTNPGQTLRAMLAKVDGAGACGAWSELFQCMAGMHGIGGRLHGVEVKPNPLACTPAVTDGFLVKNWTFYTPPSLATTATSFTSAWRNTHLGGTGDWGPGLVGQANQTPPPAFGNHFVVWDTQARQIYDPSYGSGALDIDPWMTAGIGGLLQNMAPRLGFARNAAQAPQLVVLTDLITNAAPV